MCRRLDIKNVSFVSLHVPYPQHDVSVRHVGEQERHLLHGEGPTPAGRQLSGVPEPGADRPTQHVRVQRPVFR